MDDFTVGLIAILLGKIVSFRKIIHIKDDTEIKESQLHEKE